jgi:hypothetical protein
MPKTENSRRYTAPERLFHRAVGVVGKSLQQINEQHRNDAQRTGGIPVEVPPGSFDLGTRKVKEMLNKYSQAEQLAIQDFLSRVLQDSLDATDRDD